MQDLESPLLLQTSNDFRKFQIWSASRQVNATLISTNGFRHNHSCETQLISLIQDLSLNFDSNIQTDLISTQIKPLI